MHINVYVYCLLCNGVNPSYFDFPMFYFHSSFPCGYHVTPSICVCFTCHIQHKCPYISEPSTAFVSLMELSLTYLYIKSEQCEKVLQVIVSNRQIWLFNIYFMCFCFQNTMNLPPDKVKILSQYDSEKKWDLICDQVDFQYSVLDLFTYFFILINCNWVFLLQWVELQRTKKACKEKSIRLKKIQMFWRQQKKGEIKMFLKTCISYYFIVITVKDKDFKILQTLLLLYLHTGVYAQQAVIQHKLPQQCKHWQWGKCKVNVNVK